MEEKHDPSQQVTDVTEDSADAIEWVPDEHPLPPAKRPSSNMRRCDGVSGIE